MKNLFSLLFDSVSKDLVQIETIFCHIKQRIDNCILNLIRHEVPYRIGIISN